MKFFIFYGGTFLGWLIGYGTMYGLLSSENKLDNPKFHSELVMGPMFFAAVVAGMIFVGLRLAQTGKGARHDPRNLLYIFQAGWLYFALVGIPVYLGSQLGWLTREVLPSSILLMSLIVGGILLAMDRR